MKNIICYIIFGDNQDYYNSAKFSILNLLHFTKDTPTKIIVLTEKKQEFIDYPVTSIGISKEQLSKWSLNRKYHFRIKNLGLQYIVKELNLSNDDKILFFDTDVYFKKNPLVLFSLIKESQAVMFKNEGKINKKKRFSYYQNNLKDKIMQYGNNEKYTLSSNSEMWGSAIIGIPGSAFSLVRSADALMLNLLNKLDVNMVHTIEQLSLVEVLKTKFKIIEGKKYIDIFSTSGKKHFALRQINNFLKENKHQDIVLLSELSLKLRVERSIFQIIRDKILRWIKN